MCNDNQCVKNGTYVACPICKCTYQIENGYRVRGIIYRNSKQQIAMQICSNCYKKMTSIESVSVNVGVK